MVERNLISMWQRPEDSEILVNKRLTGKKFLRPPEESSLWHKILNEMINIQAIVTTFSQQTLVITKK